MNLPTFAEMMASIRFSSKNYLKEIISEDMHKEVKFHSEEGIGIVIFKDNSKLLVVYDQCLIV